jgi:hypothetical protein
MKRLIPLVAIGAVLAAAPASASAKGTKKVIFEKTNGICTSGLTEGTPTKHSFAIFTIKTGTISVKVAVKGLKPHQKYGVDIAQTPSGEGCGMIPAEASLTTNKAGNGKVTFSEAIEPGATNAFVWMPPEPGTEEGILATENVPLK